MDRKNNILDWLEASAEKYPDKTAFEDETEKITWRDLEMGAMKIGAYLIGRERVSTEEGKTAGGEEKRKEAESKEKRAGERGSEEGKTEEIEKSAEKEAGKEGKEGKEEERKEEGKEKNARLSASAAFTSSAVPASCTFPGLSSSSINRPVAFFMEKSVPALIGMMGAVYARAFYSFIDLRQPEARMQKVMETLDPLLIFTDHEEYERAKEQFGDRYTVIDLKTLTEDPAFTKKDPGREEREALLERRASYVDTDPLYVNFTSGSTGTPKGVVVCQRSVIDFIPLFTEIFHITKKDVMGNQAPFDFDVSVKDIYSGLYTGADVVLIPRSYFVNPTKLMDYLADRNITTLVWAVSAMCFVSIMNGFQYRVPDKIEKILFSGEVMPVKQLNIWRKYLPDAVYVNLYGPTEITCNCTYYILDKDKDYALNEVIPAGKTFPNEKVFLLDEQDREVVSPKDTGEICVGGTCLAAGYYKEREKTEKVFCQNPLNPYYEERIYRTGDLGRYDEEGNLVYVSRKDFQIKHMGHRIELGEIEADAMACDGVTRACCIYDEKRKRLILFYTGDRDRKDLENDLRMRLPDFMIPNKTIALASMPLNKNGKIDRHALDDIYQNRGSRQS